MAPSVFNFDSFKSSELLTSYSTIRPPGCPCAFTLLILSQLRKISIFQVDNASFPDVKDRKIRSNLFFPD